MFATELESLEGLPFPDEKSVHSLILKNHELASMNKKNEIFLTKNDLEDEITDFSSPRPNSVENLFTHKEAEYDIVEDDNPNSSLAHFNNNVLSSDVEARNLHQSGGDFSYSQKLFHIADGNLYSIFSPLQGRSYGVKPSFLRKQRCTVQECQGRGRKSLRKGLKFHNFLPSESITSEKDDNHFEDKWKVHSECRLREEHGTKQIMISNWSLCVDQPSVQESNEKMEHCDFKEKDQNCYSPLNKLSVEMDSASNEIIEFSSLKSDLLNSLKDNRNTFSNSASFTASDVNLSATTLSEDQHLLFHQNTKSVLKNDPDCSAFSFKKEPDNEDYSFLNSMLNSENLGLQGDLKSDTMSSAECESFFKTLSVSNGRKNRRKPTQTRRVVPYTKYLSLIEENESYPLDLSSHAGSNDSSQGLCTAQNITNEGERKLLDSSNMHKRISNETFSAVEKIQGAETFEQPTGCASANETAIKLLSLQTTNISPNQMLFMNSSNKLPITPLQVNAPITYLCPIPMKQNSFSKQSESYFSQASHPYKMFDPAVVESSSSTSTTQSKPIVTQGNHVFKSLRTAAKVGSMSKSNFSYRAKHNDSASSVSSSSLEDSSILKDIIHAKPRRRSQRSVIKQKLEDTFRQNGFLVKTKQVSDGEATFCKFRQLRKYTRYYLKSWQQHLPDEVHKMWKGFLPPKTILPPISGEKKTTI